MKELSAIVVAAGEGRRFRETHSQASSKQLILWKGKPLILHTLEALFVLPIEELVLVIRPSDDTLFSEHLKNFSYRSRMTVVSGGERRQDSVREGLKKLGPCQRVLIHDGVRPFLSSDFLLTINELSKQKEALIPVLPMVETLKEVNSLGQVIQTHDRNRFVRAQTPQFFKYEIIRKVHEELQNSSQEFTDDAAMLEFLKYSVSTCLGSPRNIKVTTIDDLKGMAHVEC